MKYMLFTYRDPSVELDPEQRATVPAAVAAWCDEMDARGARLQGHVLGSLAETRTIRRREGETMVDDGPVSEQDFQIAGFTSSNAPISMRLSRLLPRIRARTSESWS